LSIKEKQKVQRTRIQGYVRIDLYKWVREEIEKGTFASESHAVERGLLLLRSYLKGELVSK